jgi:hypothetical protein
MKRFHFIPILFLMLAASMMAPAQDRLRAAPSQLQTSNPPAPTAATQPTTEKKIVAYDRASHRFGKCSECSEIICVEKVVIDGPSTLGQTSEMLYQAFRTHVKLKHSEDFNLAAVPATERHDA